MKQLNENFRRCIEGNDAIKLPTGYTIQHLCLPRGPPLDPMHDRHEKESCKDAPW